MKRRQILHEILLLFSPSRYQRDNRHSSPRYAFRGRKTMPSITCMANDRPPAPRGYTQRKVQGRRTLENSAEVDAVLDPP
jgi:hypothetical protein